MDKTLIINKIKSYLGIKTDSDFATFLGVKQPTISSWKSRNTLDYELIIAKCNDIDANWLITGKGEMLRVDEKGEKNTIVSEDFVGYGYDAGNINEKYSILQEKYTALLEQHTQLLQNKLREMFDQQDKSSNAV